MDERLKELKNIVKRLSALLDDPQTGLASWNMMLGERLQEICDFYYNGKTEAMGK